MSFFFASLAVLCASISYGMVSTIFKLAHQQGFTIAEIIGAQAFIACVSFSFLTLPHVKKIRLLSKKTLLSLLCTGFCNALTAIFYSAALSRVSASYGVILLFQFTWMGMLFNTLIHKQKPTAMQLYSLVLILIGTILASGYTTNNLEKLDLIGTIYGLCAAFFYTLFINFSGHAAPQLPTLLRNMLTSIGNMLLIFCFLPPAFLWNGSLTNGLWPWVTMYALFGSLLPVYLLAKGTPKIGTGLASLLTAAELPMVIFMAYFILKEQIMFLQWFGIFLILIALFICSYQNQQTKKLQ